MMIFDFLAYVMMVAFIVWDIEVLGYVMLGLLGVNALVKIIRSVVLSKKTFVCLDCGEVFKFKWTELYYSYATWGQVLSPESIENDGCEYKRLWVRCKKCGMMNVAYKDCQ